jgi:hypothetical protein
VLPLTAARALHHHQTSVRVYLNDTRSQKETPCSRQVVC